MCDISLEHRQIFILWLNVRCKICENIFEGLNVSEETNQSFANNFLELDQVVNPLVDWRLNPVKFLL